MQDLDVGLLGTRAPSCRARSAPAAGARPEVVETGHIGLGHRTRRGDAVRAWYRGPVRAVPDAARLGTAKDEPLALAHSADQLRRVIPDGREDLALAAAFEIGRLLALSQLSVVSALLRFRGEQFGAGRVRELLAQVLPFDAAGLAAPGERVDLGRFVALADARRAGEEPDRMIGPRRPVADPGRAAARRAATSTRSIATGLGFDLAALRKRADAVGVLAALEQTRVPLALKPGQAPNEKLRRAGAAGRAARRAAAHAGRGRAAGGGAGVVLRRCVIRRRARAAERPRRRARRARRADRRAPPARRRRRGGQRDEVPHQRRAWRSQAAVTAAHELRRHRHRPRPRRRRARRAGRAAPLPRAAAAAARRAVQLPRARRRSCCRSSRSASSTSTAPGPTRWCRARCRWAPSRSADRTQLEAVYPHIRAEVDEAERTIRQPQGEELLEGRQRHDHRLPAALARGVGLAQPARARLLARRGGRRRADHRRRVRTRAA